MKSPVCDLRALSGLWVRVLAAGLLFFCLQQAWAGFYAYQGRRLAISGNVSEAHRAYSKAHALDAQDPGLLTEWANLLWNQPLEDVPRDEQLWRLEYFRRLTEILWFYGKGWIYFAGAQIDYLHAHEPSELHLHWSEIENAIRKAVAQEPGNGWILHMAGRFFLAHSDFLSHDDVRLALSWLKESALISPQHYLTPALSVLAQYSRGEIPLTALTPKNPLSYKILCDFLERERRWTSWVSVYPEYQKIRAGAYQEHLRAGIAHFSSGRLQKSYREFQQAFWLDMKEAPARLGKLIVQQRSGHEFTSKEVDEWRQILESSGDEISPILTLAESKDMPSPYLKGLWSFRKGDFEDAVSAWDFSSPFPKTRRFFAEAYFLVGKGDRARDVLAGVLEELSPDIRDLLTLQRIQPENFEKIQERIEHLVTRYTGKKSWLGERSKQGRLYPGDKTGQVLQLYPGKSVIHLAVRFPDRKDSNSRPVIFRLGEKVIFVYYRESSRWGLIRIPVTTPGGRYWFSAELLGLPQNPSQAGAELGDLRVQTIRLPHSTSEDFIENQQL